jgi:hypothetical protein
VVPNFLATRLRHLLDLLDEELVVLTPGEDARQRIVHLTSKAERLLPVPEAEWVATTAAATEFEAELSFPLSRLVDEALDALRRRPLPQRIADVAPNPTTQPHDAP